MRLVPLQDEGLQIDGMWPQLRPEGTDRTPSWLDRLDESKTRYQMPTY